MNDLTLSPQFITRTVFQNLLHQALVAGDNACFGLLAAPVTSPHIISQSVVLKSVAKKEKIAAWSENDLVCTGLFHLEHQAIPVSIVAMMPSEYIELSISLDEKGRLDLLAYHQDKASKNRHESPLILIEDGQLEADA